MFKDSKKLIVSIGLGFFTFSIFYFFGDFSLPSIVLVGIAIFVTILALNDYLSTILNNMKYRESLNNNFFLAMYWCTYSLKESLMVLSIPLTILIVFIAWINISFEVIIKLQNILTLYSLGLTLLTIAARKEETS
ncbi:hypothetical protein KD050_05035 [Psychrobacillus sp. INOP01]|uniref:hypothetical protein n=1 Tax=Psychrobacillus sp. INOP01 TaxID=2829187 RepID=UPI001BAAA6B4|nr:hypothetical protein [Psychrobacillus sp. INOP01]QUG42641.1 hypothetical protein KD050_05035 [Psychrobacillus sp. INOP01]